MGFFRPRQVQEFVSFEDMERLLKEKNNNVVQSGSEGKDKYYVVRCESRGTSNCNKDCLLDSTSSACSSVERGS